MSESAQLKEARGAAPRPEPREIPGRQVLEGVFAVCATVGAIAFVVSLGRGATLRAWEAFLVNLLFWTGIAQGGVTISAAFYLTQARWGGAAQYRLAEAFAGFLPVGFFLFWALIFGRDVIFPWVTHPIAQKAAWLNTPFLFSRDGLSLFAITLVSLWFVRESRKPATIAWVEAAADIELPPPIIRRLAPTVAILFAAIYSLLAFDLVMSLAPMWRSTLFGAFFFAGAWWSGLVAMALATVLLGRALGAGNRLAEKGFMHDLGKLIFAFSVFWVYLVFSQFIVIWYADIPVETFWVVPRVMRLPWGILGWGSLILIWATPFVVLMGRRPKRTPAILGSVAALGLIGVFVERYLLVVPSLSPAEIPFGGIEALVTLGFLGAFGLCALPGLARVAQVAMAVPDGRHE